MLRRPLLALALVALVAGTAAAHAPAFAADNTTPETAHEVDPPTKSWAVYDSLSADGVRYYELRLSAGQRLELSVFTPGEGAFTPQFVVMGPNVDAADEVPDRVTVPDGYGARVVEGERPADPAYEPNTPAANYETASYGRQVESGGRYLVAVYEPRGRAGQVGVVAGDRESFTAGQYLRVAVDLPRIYLWEGDSPLLVFGPVALALVAGLSWGRDRTESLSVPRLRLGLVAAGSLMVGTSAVVALEGVQALAAAGFSPGAFVTAIFVALPGVLGGLVLKLATDPGYELAGAGRALLLIAGLGGLATWAGYVVAPLAVLSVALWPKEPFGA